MLEHGGRLLAAAARSGIPAADWLDLSTGIAPWSYPISIATEAWRRLPEDEDGLEAVAAGYYGHPAPLAVPGSQAAIQLLPRLLSPGRTVLAAPSYAEYAPAWRAAGHRVAELPYAAVGAGAADADVLMLASPNNPSGERLGADALCALAAAQERRGGWLVVDAAFGDHAPAASLDAHAGGSLPRLVVLHSLGKFFGLAGARVGFCCAAAELRRGLAEAIGPWAVANPSRRAAAQALADRNWQAAQRQRLAQACARLGHLLQDMGLPSVGGGDLFRYAPMPRAEELHDFLARRGILVRLFRYPPALRFGLPGVAGDWQRLTLALSEWRSS